MDKGEHLSERGINLIKDIKSRMNLRRSRQGQVLIKIMGLLDLVQLKIVLIILITSIYYLVSILTI